MVFKTLESRRWSTVISPRAGRMTSVPLLPPAYCLERVSRPWHKEGELRLIPEDSLSWDGAENQIKEAGVCRNWTWEISTERQRQRSVKTPHWVSAAYWPMYTCEEAAGATPGDENEQMNRTQCSHRARSRACSLPPNWKTSLFIGHPVMCSDRCGLRSENN